MKAARKAGADTGVHCCYPRQVPAVASGRGESLERLGTEEGQDFLGDRRFVKVGVLVKSFH